jgi:hypothetical protein
VAKATEKAAKDAADEAYGEVERLTLVAHGTDWTHKLPYHVSEDLKKKRYACYGDQTPAGKWVSAVERRESRERYVERDKESVEGADKAGGFVLSWHSRPDLAFAKLDSRDASYYRNGGCYTLKVAEVTAVEKATGSSRAGKGKSSTKGKLTKAQARGLVQQLRLERGYPRGRDAWSNTWKPASFKVCEARGLVEARTETVNYHGSEATYEKTTWHLTAKGIDAAEAEAKKAGVDVMGSVQLGTDPGHCDGRPTWVDVGDGDAAGRCVRRAWRTASTADDHVTQEEADKMTTPCTTNYGEAA